MKTFLDRVELALQDLRNGKMIILTDHPNRENEGDLIFLAEKTTPQNINFMIRNCSGIICLAMTSDYAKKLKLEQMVASDKNTSSHKTPFTVSIEAKKGVTTGVSAADRTTTILTAIDSSATSDDLACPGHVFPLLAKDGGVLERQGHTEGAVDLAKLANFKSAAVLCEIMNPDGTMAKGKELENFAKVHDLKMLSIEEIVQYRHYHENLIEDEVVANLPLEQYGDFEIAVIKEKFTQKEHIILSNYKNENRPPLVRMHSSCMTGDLFGSQRCDCHSQLHYTLQKLSEEGGILIYLNQEGRGIGLFNKIKTYALQEQGLDTVEANEKLGLPVDSREYYLAANFLKNRNIRAIQLMTNNPKKAEGLEKYGIKVQSTYEMPVFCSAYNENYLKTKKNKLNHIINFIKKSEDNLNVQIL